MAWSPRHLTLISPEELVDHRREQLLRRGVHALKSSANIADLDTIEVAMECQFSTLKLGTHI
jgi:hypothetical protein